MPSFLNALVGLTGCISCFGLILGCAAGFQWLFLKGRQNDHQAATASETPLHGLSRPSAQLSVQKAVVVAYWEKPVSKHSTRVDFNIFNITVIHLFALTSIFALFVVTHGAFNALNLLSY